MVNNLSKCLKFFSFRSCWKKVGFELPQFTETATVGGLMLLRCLGSSLSSFLSSLPSLCLPCCLLAMLSPKEGWGPCCDFCYLAIFSSRQPFLAITIYRPWASPWHCQTARAWLMNSEVDSYERKHDYCTIGKQSPGLKWQRAKSQG